MDIHNYKENSILRTQLLVPIQRLLYYSTSIIRKPLYYGQFLRSRQVHYREVSLYFPLNLVTLLRQTILHTLMQGLYPEQHGIVSNYFYDRDFNETFYISSPTALDPKWWFGEPVSNEGTRILSEGPSPFVYSVENTITLYEIFKLDVKKSL